MIQAHATLRYVRTSAQKAGLVLELIRGKDVNRALATLHFTKKSIAGDVAKLLRSAIANAQQKEGFSGDVDRLFVSECYANQGPSQKRIRPAPMGRAFRIVKRTAHLTVQVSERPVHIAAPATPEHGGASTHPGGGGPKRPRGAKPKAKPKTSAKAATKRNAKAGAKKKTAAAKAGRAKKTAKS